MKPIIQELNKANEKEAAPLFEIGDTVDVHVRIVEGEKERIQIFNGTVIGRKGSGINESFTVRHLFAGEGVERVFPVHSPHVEKVEVKRRGRARRAKLYYLRDQVGKKAILKEENRKRVTRNLETKATKSKGKKKKAKKAE
ncbi:MAG: 50S ribosomal protein L19 [Planctomycetes bacterium]|nr:50S ribosomal protein L19 [Planctomycetota bacterium]